MAGLASAAVKLVLSGPVNSEQRWSTGIWVAVSGSTPSQIQLNAFGADAVTAISTPANGAALALWQSMTGYDTITPYYYAANSLHATLVGAPQPASQFGTGSTGSVPAQCALVASLRSSTPGRSGRGRNYIPLSKPGAMGNDSQATTSACTALASAWAAVLAAINGLTTSPFTSPQVSVASFTKGVLYPVTRVVVDSIVDTQRRREGSMLASSISAQNV